SNATGQVERSVADIAALTTRSFHRPPSIKSAGLWRAPVLGGLYFAKTDVDLLARTLVGKLPHTMQALCVGGQVDGCFPAHRRLAQLHGADLPLRGLAQQSVVR